MRSRIDCPFECLALVLAIMWGITIFGEWPDLVAWTGIGNKPVTDAGISH